MKNFTTIALLTMLVSSNAFAQPGLKRQTDIGGNKEDELFKMCNTRDGGTIMIGASYSDSSFDKSQTNRGKDDYWVVKLNKAGKKEWDKTFGGSDEDDGFAVKQTTDGGYILGGTSYSNKSIDKSEDSKGESDFWVIKIDSLGNKQWDKTYGGKRSEFMRELQQTTDGGYILGGGSFSGIAFDKSEKSRGLEDYWLVKIDAQGNKQWDKTLGGNSYDEAFAVQQTNDGGYIAGGFSESDSSGEKSQRKFGSRNYWIVKTDAQGNKQWDKTYGGKISDEVRTILQIKDGSYIIGGFSSSPQSTTKSENSRGDYDYWIIKITGDGKEIWDKTIGGTLTDYFGSLEQTKDGGYILAGTSSSGISGEKTEVSRGAGDYWLVKINKQGSVLWDKTIGGDGWDQAFSVIEKGKDNFIIGGFSASGISGDKTEAVKGNTEISDYWLVNVKYDSILSTAVINTIKTISNNKDFIVYPVPAKNVLHVQSAKAFFTLINSSGKVVLSTTIINDAAINVAHLPSGIYYLNNTNTGVTKKIVISK